MENDRFCLNFKFQLMDQIDPIKMDKVLKSKRSNLRWEEIKQSYENWRPKFTNEVVNRINNTQLCQVSKVFFFTETTNFQCKRELNTWLKNFPEFFAEDFDAIISNIQKALTEYDSQVPYPYINFIPEYGGLINQKRKKKDEQMRFNASNGISLLITGEVPVLKD